MPLGEIHEIQDDAGNGIGEFEYECESCSTWWPYESEARRCCVFECPECGETYNYEDDAQTCCRWNCPECGESYRTEDDAENCCGEREDQRDPYFPEEVLRAEITHPIYLPAIENRPARMCSIEQELSAGGAAIANMIYTLGYSDREIMSNYSNEGRAGGILVKEDGSLPYSGGEVVYSRFWLDNLTNSEALSKTLACIEQMHNEGYAETDPCAGTHIHISAKDYDQKVFGPAQMAALYEIFSFSEDVIFRIGAAGWPAHRGSSFTRLMPKMNDPQDRSDPNWGISAGKIAKMSRRERYYSINFQRLLNAVQSCRCGACMVGDWNECDCGVLDSGTIEWRIFNSTTNPQIIHAWILLAHGMTAASFTHQLGTLDPHEFNNTDSELHPWIFGWMLWNCPFLDEERQVLFDVARQAPGLNLPWENIDQFHERWGEIEIPTAPEPEVTIANDSILSRRYVPGCTCEDCRVIAEAHREASCWCPECMTARPEPVVAEPIVAEPVVTTPRFEWSE